MTIAVSVKVHDGIVLAADSASTLFGQVQSPQGQTAQGVLNVYTHANKIFNLRKGLPVAAITWGSGSIGVASISTLAKDLRKRFTDASVEGEEWVLEPREYSMETVAMRVREFFYEERYQALYEDSEEGGNIGFFIAGYSSGADTPEIWECRIAGGQCPEPSVRKSREDTGIDWSGNIEAITRLVNGHGTDLPQALASLGVPDEQLQPAIEQIRNALGMPLAPAPMPIQDAIDLAHFFVDASVKYSRFTPGAPTVGGPIEVAAITKHEGFKWVERKHYYSARLNPHAFRDKDLTPAQLEGAEGGVDRG